MFNQEISVTICICATSFDGFLHRRSYHHRRTVQRPTTDIQLQVRNTFKFVIIAVICNTMYGKVAFCFKINKLLSSMTLATDIKQCSLNNVECFK